MLENMKWLRAEWRYWFEWRRLYVAHRLDVTEQPPEKNNPWKYTFRWAGVAIALPMTIAVVLAGIVRAFVNLGSKDHPGAEVIVVLTIILSIIGWGSWIIYSLVCIGDEGPSHVVKTHWDRQHGKSTK